MVLYFLSANPLKTSQLALDEEIREIKEGLRRSRDRDYFSIESYQIRLISHSGLYILPVNYLWLKVSGKV